jgi:hypothetical protein
MKNLFLIGLITLFGCQSENKETEIFPLIYHSDNDVAIYEGVIPLESGEELTMELTLFPGSPGLDADYRLEEWSNEHNNYIMGRNSFNKYTTLVGANPEEVIIKLHKCRINRMLIHGDETPGQLKKIQDSHRKSTDLYFKSKGDDLILVDENFQAIDASKYSLVRRSKTFTVEGYITFVNDTSEFFEMNTRETWALGNRGMFAEARNRYLKLAKEKYEGIYVKALAYSVNHLSPSGKNIDALVFRKIYDMHAGKTVNPQ